MKKLVLIVGIISCLFSCEKNDKQDESENLVSTYLPMSVGNYWVYQVYNIDVNGNKSQSTTLDSTVITKDTLINGKKYYRFDYLNYHLDNINHFDTAYLRDSLTFIINEKGNILFSENNFNDTLYRKTYVFENDTFYTMTCKMERIDQEISTPAGSFNNILNFRGTVIVNPKHTDIENPRYTDEYFAKDMGVVYQSQTYVSGGQIREKRLVRYHINK